MITQTLEHADPEVLEIIEREKQRQRESISLIPSEVSPTSYGSQIALNVAVQNFTSRSVLEALGSVMQNKYSEGIL